MKWILLIILATSSAYANLNKAPSNFQTKQGMAIFIDFKNVKTNIEYNVKARTTKAKTIIQFESISRGLPIFDLIPKSSNAKLNGKAVEILQVNSPNDITTYKLVNQIIEAGTHTLELENTISDNINYGTSAVRSAFWMSDLNDRRYIERYIPTNIEFDQYQLTLRIKISGDKNTGAHEIYSNGNLREVTKNNFTIDYPDYFSASSFYFHLTPKDAFKKVTFDFESVSGKSIPVVLYARYSWGLSKAKKITISTLTELEKKLGAWSHPNFTAYIAGSGGMEYSGATMSSTGALGHEITHSYFARGVMPVDGNSGWMDEAIASWRDDGYKLSSSPNFSSTTMSGHSQYKRSTDRKAYTQGANFMAYLNHELKEHGGLINFLRGIYSKYSHKNISTNIFKKELELHTGRDFTAEFDQYIFGLTHVNGPHVKTERENPYHPKLSKQQQKDLL